MERLGIAIGIYGNMLGIYIGKKMKTTIFGLGRASGTEVFWFEAKGSGLRIWD